MISRASAVYDKLKQEENNMQTLDAPIYEVKQESDWYKSEKKRKEDINLFFDKFEEKYGVKEGFSFYHSEYFGVYEGTEAYEIFKNDIVKNPVDGFYAIKKRSKYFKEIKAMIEQIEKVNPFRSHDELGLNNMTGRQWIGDRWFFGVKTEQLVKGDSVVAIDYKEYLKIVMEHLD
ncbi:hypothetical protein [Bacillus stercoris]|uniref:hypothetical protein n=1 Tax=Bacillus stercoris TaxID=2054641 RepID=UPI001FB25289|nr:hypothetical protein [Bacillus stercoris]